MDEFLSRYIITIVAVVFLILVIGRILLLMRRARKIEKEGVEVDAVISRVEYEADPDDGDAYHIYTRYVDDMGAERESITGIFAVAEYEEGQEVRIRFIPGEYDMVRIVSR